MKSLFKETPNDSKRRKGDLAQIHTELVLSSCLNSYKPRTIKSQTEPKWNVIYENRRISCGEREGVGGGSHLGVLFESDECGFTAPLLFRGPPNPAFVR